MEIMPSFQDLMISFFGIYSENYIKNNGLFIVYDKDKNIKFKTKNVTNYSEDIILTDLAFIFGEYQTITSDNPEAVEVLTEILKNNNWDKFKYLATLQGLILGTTAFKVGLDEFGNAKFELVKLLDCNLKPVYQGNDFMYWHLKSRYKDSDNSFYEIEEYFSKEFYRRYEDGKLVIDIPNRYGIPWLFVIPNRPSLTHDWRGKSEWDRYRNIIDEINSKYSKMSRIEDTFADPKFIGKGITDAEELKLSDKMWFVADPNADIKVIEIQGNVLQHMLNGADKLEAILKDQAPELILNNIDGISGRALQQKLTKLEKKIKTLRETYFNAFKQLFGLLYEMQTGNKVKFKYTADSVLPTDDENLLNKLAMLDSMGIISKETIATELGYDYQEEMEKIAKEQSFAGVDINEQKQLLE